MLSDVAVSNDAVTCGGMAPVINGSQRLKIMNFSDVTTMHYEGGHVAEIAVFSESRAIGIIKSRSRKLALPIIIFTGLNGLRRILS